MKLSATEAHHSNFCELDHRNEGQTGRVNGGASFDMEEHLEVIGGKQVAEGIAEQHIPVS